MAFFTMNLNKKTPHMGFLPHVQLDQNVILNKSFYIWPLWLGLFGWFFLLDHHDNNVIWAVTNIIFKFLFKIYMKILIN
jgi:hypothetical protein